MRIKFTLRSKRTKQTAWSFRQFVQNSSCYSVLMMNDTLRKTLVIIIRNFIVPKVTEKLHLAVCFYSHSHIIGTIRRYRDRLIAADRLIVHILYTYIV